MQRRERYSDDPRLERRIRELLRKLSMVNEAPGSSILKFGGGEHESAPPRAVRQKTSVTKLHKPPRYRFLLDHYVSEFEGARGSDGDLRMICVQAEIDLGERGRLGDRDTSNDMNLTAAELQEEVERHQADQVRILIERGEGIHYLEVATEEGWPAGWVKTTRERHGREPVYGRERPVWKELSDRERRALCWEYAEQGLSIRDASSLIGVGKSTVGRYWPAEATRAA